MSQRSFFACLGCCLFWWAASCATPSTDTSTGSGGKGGSTTSEGGNRGSGGQTTGTGGSSTGGNIGSGGTGGALGSGGATATGGTVGSGGRGGSGTGGSTGGSTGSTGGMTGRGGSGTGGTGGSGTGGSGTGGTSSGGTTGRGGTNGTGGPTSTGGSPGANQPPPITNGMSGWASRYWDCCKPACGWKANVSHGNPMMSCDMSNNSLGGNYDAKNSCESGGTAFMCWSGSPWQVSSTLSYGFAAASGSNYSCGRCYQIQFTGTNNTSGDHKGVPALNGKTMIVQVINNGGVQSNQFDILIPGGGVGALNGCSKQWGSGTDLGTQYGGYLAECNGDSSCVQQKCQAAFGNRPQLLSGCMWFLDWYGGSNNPDFTYQKIACPSALTQASGLSDPG